jgi:hypothetical protein
MGICGFGVKSREEVDRVMFYTMQCRYCVCWTRNESYWTDYGCCRRHAPVPRTTTQMASDVVEFTMCPSTHETAWCLEGVAQLMSNRA